MLKRRAGYLSLGALAGSIGAMIGVGGGVIASPFLVWSGMAQKVASGTTLPMVLVSSSVAAYTWSTYAPVGVGPDVMGAAVLGTSAALFSPLGVRLSHHLPGWMMTRAMGVFMVGMGVAAGYTLLQKLRVEEQEKQQLVAAAAATEAKMHMVSSTTTLPSNEQPNATAVQKSTPQSNSAAVIAVQVSEPSNQQQHVSGGGGGAQLHEISSTAPHQQVVHLHTAASSSTSHSTSHSHLPNLTPIPPSGPPPHLELLSHHAPQRVNILTTTAPLTVLTATVGASIGLIGGAFGVGGGVLLVPILTAITGDIQTATATSLVSIIFPTFVATVAASRRGSVDWRVVPWLVVGASVASYFSAEFAANTLTKDQQKMAFSSVMLLLGGRLLLHRR